MRRAFLLASVSAGLMAAAACASSEEDVLTPEAGAAPQPGTPPDGGTAEDDGGRALPIRDASTCSEAGWCETALPEQDLVLKDIWPLEGRAFAIAESETFGVKVLEWEDATQAWKFIDDNTQNEYGLGKFAGKVWAPSANEVYYAVAPGLIYRGERGSPSSPWSWQREQLADNSRDTDPEHDHGLAYYYDFRGQVGPALLPALGVWGTSSEDVYAWYANTIFHRKREDGGAASWTAEYVLDDPEDAGGPPNVSYVLSATGSGPDDVWFASGRVRYGGYSSLFRETTNYGCAIVIHKSADGYQRLVDGTVDGNASSGLLSCDERTGTKRFEVGYYVPYTIPGFVDAGFIFGPYNQHGWVTNIDSAGPNAIVGVFEGEREALAYVTSEDGGLARRNLVDGLTFNGGGDSPLGLYSVWNDGADAWVSGWGAMLRFETSPDTWRLGMTLSAEGDSDYDGGKYTTSTVAIDGRPVAAPLSQVRGTSNTNLWAIGANHALHKTTP